MQLSGVTELCLTKLDVLTGLDELQVGNGYKLNGQAVRYADIDAYELGRVDIAYQNVSGWRDEIGTARSYQELPAAARVYVKMIEEAAEVPVKWIGVGPEREATIRR